MWGKSVKGSEKCEKHIIWIEQHEREKGGKQNPQDITKIQGLQRQEFEF